MTDIQNIKAVVGLVDTQKGLWIIDRAWESVFAVFDDLGVDENAGDTVLFMYNITRIVVL
jgi:hypothetical protein